MIKNKTAPLSFLIDSVLIGCVRFACQYVAD